MLSINDQLRDQLLKRSHYVFLYENGVIKRLVKPYHLAKGQLISKVQKLEDYGQGYTIQYRLDRLNSQIAEINAILQNSTFDSIQNLSYDLNNFAMQEKEYYENLLGTKFGQLGINLTRIPVEQVAEIVNTPIGGEMYYDRMNARYGKGLRDVKRELTQSVIQGEDMARASRRLFGIGEGLGGILGQRLTSEPAIIARTEIMRVSNAVSERVYNENTDVLKGVSWIATLDIRTCLVCGSLDGKTFYYNKGQTPPPRPLHPYCRCCLLPVTKSWQELEKEAGIKRVGPPLREIPETTRASFTGQVPAALNYNDWLKQMNVSDPDFVLDVLGTKRYRQWNAGKLELKEMVKGNRILTLEELGMKGGGG